MNRRFGAEKKEKFKNEKFKILKFLKSIEWMCIFVYNLLF
jgi:hypothetical protein